SPVPTTMTVKRRLFAGFTSFTSNLWCSHFSATGPAGTLESRVAVTSLASRHGCRHVGRRTRVRRLRCAIRAARGLDEMQLHREREAHVASDDDRRET